MTHLPRWLAWSLVLVPWIFGGCVDEPRTLAVCEEVELKLALCDPRGDLCQDDPAACECSSQDQDERSRCELRCVLEATCDDFGQNFPTGGRLKGSADVQGCIGECRGTDGVGEDAGSGGGTGSDEFRCGDGELITSDWVCDEIPDCADESDEADCV